MSDENPYLHAHIETESSDCDGKLSSGHIVTMNDDDAKFVRDMQELFADRLTFEYQNPPA